ncbi:MAG: succinate dehydrogenase assembly factor 2 [Gammaproteobacteria bacterium]
MSAESQLTPAQRQQRLSWQCRRGMLELDILLQGFVTHCYPGLSETEKQTFDRLLTHADQELLEYFLNQAQPDDKDIAALVQSIRHAATL